MTFWKKTCAPLMLVGLVSPALVNCDALSKVANAAGVGCPAMDDGNFAALKLEGDAKVQGDLKGFLESVYTLRKLSVEMETNLIASCFELGKAIGMDEAQLKAEPADGDGAKKVCGGVAEKVKSMIDASGLASGKASLAVEIGEPRCDVDVDAMLGCYKDCGVTIDPGKLEASCEGGEISGQCDAECTGTCELEAGAACSGTCAGSCEGKCDGKAQKGAATCAGKCDGKCSGSCKVTGKAQCSGKCTGGCSATIKAPKCSGEFKPPSVDLSCQMSCASKMASQVVCTPPSVKVTLEGKVDAKVKTDLVPLINGLQVALPKIANLQLGVGKRLVSQGKALIEYGAKMPEIAQQAGTQAVSCIATATGVAGKVGAAFSANVEVSVNVSASVKGSAEAKGGT